MEVLVAGASSVIGVPTIRELVRRGHAVHALTRSRRNAEALHAIGARPWLGDVFDLRRTQDVLHGARPEALVSLLIPLPRSGPKRVTDLRAAARMWRDGVPNLLTAAREAGVRRVVAESVIFAYGYAWHTADSVQESYQVRHAAPPLGQEWVLRELHAMERRVLGSADFEGSVLRYGVLHGPSVPTTQLLIGLLRRHVPVVPGNGRAILSWVEISDAARATTDAVERAGGGELYNVVDDEPTAFRAYVRRLAQTVRLPTPRRVPQPLARLAAPYLTLILDRVRLPVANTKAKEELGWRPRYATPDAAFRLIGRDLGVVRTAA